MKKTVLHLVFFCAYAVYGQKLTIGPEHKVPDSPTFLHVVYSDEKGVNCIYLKNGKWGLLHYDNKMNLSTSVDVEMEVAGGKLDFDKVVSVDGKMFLAGRFSDTKGDKIKVYIQEINPATLQTIGGVKQISEVPVRSKGAGNQYWFVNSPDHSILLFYGQTFKSAGSPEKFIIQVHDSKDFAKKWGKEIELPYDDNLFEMKRMQVDNEGNVYLAGILFNEKTDYKTKGKPNFKWVIYKYGNSTTPPVLFELVKEGLFMTDFSFGINQKGELICGGVYSKVGMNSIDGVFYCAFDQKTGQVSNMKFSELPAEGSHSGLGSDLTPENDQELWFYELQDMIPKKNGGAYIIAEEKEKMSISGNLPQNASAASPSVYEFRYRDIIISSISPSGEIEKIVKIHKEQAASSVGVRYLSYLLSFAEDTLFFVYNDDPGNSANMSSNGIKVYSGGSEPGCTMLATLYPNGEVKKEVLFMHKEEGFVPEVLFNRDMKSTASISFFGGKPAKFRVAKIEF